MLRLICLLLSFVLIACQPVAQPLVDITEKASEKGMGEEDVYFEELPELNQKPVEQKPNYDFLNKEVFWERVEEVIRIPSFKSCSNEESYAHFGIARLVYQEIYGDFPLLPFGNQMRYVPFFEEWPEIPEEHELFLSFGLMKKLNEITRYTNLKFSVPLTLTSLTTYSGLDHDAHCRHRSGTVIDIRPFPATRPMTWRDPAYDFNMNLVFTKYLLKREDVSLIFFNDPNLLDHPEVKDIIATRAKEGNPVIFQAVGGHDNHYHIEFKLDSEVDYVSRFIKQRLGFLN